MKKFIPKNEIDDRLRKLTPIRVVIRKNSAGKIEGQVEHSFSMGWSENFVNIYWSGKAYSILGEHELNGIEWANGNAVNPGEMVIDPLAPDSPIQIDWTAWHTATSKFDKRNAPFTVVPKP